MDVEAVVLSLANEVRLMRESVDALVKRQVAKEVYSTEEFAKATGLKPKTVRDYCNQGRLSGLKKRCGHGRSKQWVIPHSELARYEREGPLDPTK